MPTGVYKRIHTVSKETRRKMGQAWLGKQHTPEQKKKISDSHKGIPRSEETKLKIKKSLTGKRHSQKTKDKMRESHIGMFVGEKSSSWIKDRSKLSKRKDRRSPAFYEWRHNVRKRDNFQCKLKSRECCGRLEVHHIFNWIDYPELRYLVNNGIVLCKFHHPYGWEEEKRMIPIFQEII